MKSNNGPSIERGTPQWICSNLKLKPFMLPYCDRFWRYEESQLLATSPLMP